MNLDPVKVITQILSCAAPQGMKYAQRNEIAIQVLKNLKLDPAHPPKDFHGVYAYALVEFGIDKPEPILKLFRERDISVLSRKFPRFFESCRYCASCGDEFT